ncbi:hypothetical protein BDY21DRAFT_110310 [Lineolata rhizophorae]|uniref:Uncharacterized protein n=1 Tax=Lineolata rhizophorae TaxID=578093 RepID=A0A6A6NRF5_9PEZI|nr:hypothetical protein BDY21DRAFT_110310 [Lineolata rhizophorae]
MTPARLLHSQSSSRVRHSCSPYSVALLRLPITYSPASTSFYLYPRSHSDPNPLLRSSKNRICSPSGSLTQPGAPQAIYTLRSRCIAPSILLPRPRSTMTTYEQHRHRPHQQPVYGSTPPDAAYYGSTPPRSQPQPIYRSSQPQLAYGSTPPQGSQPAYGSTPPRHAQPAMYGTSPSQQQQYASRPAMYGTSPSSQQQLPAQPHPSSSGAELLPSDAYGRVPSSSGTPRRPSHESTHSHHSHRSAHSPHRGRNGGAGGAGGGPAASPIPEERRPTLGDTLFMMWDAVKGVVKGKRR